MINKSVNPLSPSSSSSTTTNNPIPINDPLHGRLLGNTTAFDAVTTHQQPTVTTSPKKLIINGKTLPFIFFYEDFFNLGDSPSPFDLDDKEVEESMSCTTNYPLQFEACMFSIVRKMN